MAKHTPGPWQVLGSHNNTNTRRVFASDGRGYVCIVGGSDDAPELVIANARLIAAAPEMLELLRTSRESLIYLQRRLADALGIEQSVNITTLQIEDLISRIEVKP